jgi:hypothetical protein
VIRSFHPLLEHRKNVQKGKDLARCRGLTPVIPATQEADIRRIAVRSHPEDRSSKPSWANSSWDSISKKKKSTKNLLVEWLKV